MAGNNNIHSGTLQAEPSQRELRHGALARRAASEGIVLLKNEDVLPLTCSTPIALLGKGASRTVKGGTGSGDVNNRKSISIYDGLRMAGVTLTSEKWLSDYESRYTAAREAWREKILNEASKVENPFDAYAGNPFTMPEGSQISAEDLRDAEAAVYVLSRISGEGKDRDKEEGDYYLSFREQEDLLYLNQQKIPVVLIINAGGPVEITDILQKAPYIKAVLNISQLGQEGGHAVADILLGQSSPSGKLTATWAKRYEDYPSADSYSYINGNLETEEYREGIYVGYRYFDSFGVEPLYPFGFGLSYTTFDLRLEGIEILDTSIRMEILVKNSGAVYAGKEVVQIYAALPQTGEPKEVKRLAGFAKTRCLMPQEEQKISIIIPQKQLGIFSQKKQGWIIEKGEYGLWISNGASVSSLAALLQVQKETILEQTHRICPENLAFEELGMTSCGKEKADSLLSRAKQQGVPVVPFCPHEEHQKIPDQPPAVKNWPVSDLLPLLYGNITKGASNLGSAGIRVPGSAGETTEELEQRGVPSLIMADGPAGLRLRQSYEVDRKSNQIYGTGVLGSLENGFLEPAQKHEDADTYYQYCTAFPVGTALAQTWNLELAEEFGEAVAAEMEEFHVHLWLAPGMNIHRNPLCGRNFEYYSEDPFLSGMMAAAITKGVQKRENCGVTIKHFACNNQEDNRMAVNVRISERALREIYLRGFELAVKLGSPAAMMSSYNKLNGIQAANHPGLCTVIAREEWGFSGVIISDWNTTVPKEGSVPWKCAAAGNDIIMPGNHGDEESIRTAYETGELSEDAIRTSAGRILALAHKLGGCK